MPKKTFHTDDGKDKDAPKRNLEAVMHFTLGEFGSNFKQKILFKVDRPLPYALEPLSDELNKTFKILGLSLQVTPSDDLSE